MFPSRHIFSEPKVISLNSLLCPKDGEDQARHNFLESEVTSLNGLFCPTDSPTPKDIYCSMISIGETEQN